MRQRPGDQPLPKPNEQDMARRRKLGVRGRDMLRDLDSVVYLRAVMYERDGK